MSEEKNVPAEDTSAEPQHTHYVLVGMGRNAVTRTQRKLNRSAIRGRRMVRVGPYLIRPNRTVTLPLVQIEAYASQIRAECESGRLQIRDGDHRLVDLDEILEGSKPMPDLSKSTVDELVSMMKDADEDPPFLAHIKAALVEKAVANIQAETSLDGLEELARHIEMDASHPLSMAEIELALADRIKELRDAEKEEVTPSSTPEEQEDGDLRPYSEWEYGALKAEVKKRGLEAGSMKKDDLIAVLELDDEDAED